VLLRGFEAEVEVLVQQRRGEGRREVEVHDRRRLVAGEHRAHHALVEELEEGRARDPALLRQHGDLGQRLRDHAEHQVVADLHETSGIALPDIGRAGAEELEVRPRRVPRVVRARHDDGELAGIDDRRVAAHGSGEQRDAALVGDGTHLGRGVGRDGRGVDDHGRSPVRRREQAAFARDDLLEVRRAGDHREHDVSVGEVGRDVDDGRAQLGERLGLRARAVVHREVAPGLQQASRERKPHPARPHPAERLGPHVERHPCKRLHRLGGRVKLTEVDARQAGCNRLQHGTPHVRDDGRRLGGARALRPPA
jgi:hypothetical protein